VRLGGRGLRQRPAGVGINLLVITRPRPSAVPPTVVVFCQDELEAVLARLICSGRVPLAGGAAGHRKRLDGGKIRLPDAPLRLVADRQPDPARWVITANANLSGAKAGPA
jgi:hypothetical protein